MKYKKLGNTDIDVSLICLGTMNMGEQNTQEESFEQMNYSLEKGVNFFDTAEVYAVPPRKETSEPSRAIVRAVFTGPPPTTESISPCGETIMSIKASPIT